MTTFDEWYQKYPISSPAKEMARAAYEAGAQTARHSALVDAVAEANRAGIAGGGCDCNFAPCEHDQVRIRIVSAIAQLAAAIKETKP